MPDGTGTIPLKHRKPGESREIPVPSYVRDAIAEHVRDHGTRDGYLFAGARTRYLRGQMPRPSVRRADLFAGLEHCSLPVWPGAFRSPTWPSGSGTGPSRSPTGFTGTPGALGLGPRHRGVGRGVRRVVP